MMIPGPGGGWIDWNHNDQERWTPEEVEEPVLGGQLEMRLEKMRRERVEAGRRRGRLNERR